MFINNVPDYLNLIKALGHEEASGQDNWQSGSAFVYRGINDSKHKLLPGILRKMQSEGYENESKYKASEKAILSHFIQEASVYHDQFSSDDRYHWVQLAQHYGVPTRLLDWTKNSLVALFFSCNGREEKDGVVWILHKDRYLKFSTKDESIDDSPQNVLSRMLSNCSKQIIPEYPFLFVPYYFDQRMTAQASWFMSWGRNPSCLEDMLNDKIMELPNEQIGDIIKREIYTYDLLSNHFKQECIVPIFIKGEDKAIIIEELDALGVNEKTLFPGIGGVGKYIENKYNQDVK